MATWKSPKMDAWKSPKMDAWKSPKRFISDMMDSIELVAIKLPAAREYKLLDDDSGAKFTDRTSQSSNESPLQDSEPAQNWWRSHISVIVPPDSDVRDYLALERTFLAHFHTSVALIEVSVYISQWYVLQEASGAEAPNNPGLRRIGTTLSCALITWAMVVNIIGAARFFRIQSRLLNRMSVEVGGWDLKLEGIGVFAVILLILVMTLMEE